MMLMIPGTTANTLRQWCRKLSSPPINQDSVMVKVQVKVRLMSRLG